MILDEFFDGKELDALNGDQEIHKKAAESLKANYRYKDEFYFEPELPF